MIKALNPNSARFPWRRTSDGKTSCLYLHPQLSMVYNLILHGLVNDNTTEYLNAIALPMEGRTWCPTDADFSTDQDISALLESTSPDADFEARVHKVSVSFGLDEIGARVVLFLFFMNRNPELSAWLLSFSPDLQSQFIEVVLQADLNTIGQVTGTDSPFLGKGILEDDHPRRKPHHNALTVWTLSGAVCTYLSGDSEHLWDDDTLEEYQPNAKAVEDPGLSGPIVETLFRLVAGADPFQGLVYGEESDDDKFEFLGRLARRAGKKLMVLRYEETFESVNVDLRQTLNLLSCSADSREMIIVLPGAQEYLSTENPNLNSLNRDFLKEFIGKPKCSMVWLTQRIHGSAVVRHGNDIRPSVLALFDVVVEQPKVKILTPPSWEADSRAVVAKVRGEFQLDREQVNRAVGVWERTNAPGDPKELQEARLRDLLAMKQSVLGTPMPVSVLSPVSKNLERKLWNADTDLNDLEQSVGEYLSWLPDHREEKFAFTVLFSGVPGTGRTEYCKYLADRMGKRLTVIRSSDLIQPLVGNTEIAIASVFEEAGDSILFFDEVDSLLFSRTLARNHWELAMVNTFLVNLENTGCLTLMATNYAKKLDEAIVRRCNFKIEFLPLRQDQLDLAWTTYFPNLRVPANGLKDLTGLAPGDFRTVWAKARFRSVKPTSDQVYGDLMKEKSAKERFAGGAKKVGFQ
jgi:hypothetical protein